MSETSSKSTADTSVSMRKRPVRATSGGEPPARIETPPMINYALIALGVLIGATVIRALSLLGSTSALQSFLVDSNKHAKKPKSPYGPAQISHDLHALRQGTLIEAAVITVAVGLLIFAMRRTRSASGSRWALLVVLVLTSLPFYVIPISGFPTVPKVAGVVVGVASIAALVLVFATPSAQKYFRDCREANTPPELRGQPRPSLFGPRRPRAGMGRPEPTPQPATRPATTRPAGAAKARSKVRADSESVARGAELARARAKASKSRRTAD